MLNAKYKVEKMFLKQVFNYLRKNPEENLEKIMKWIRKFDTEHLYNDQYDVIEGYIFTFMVYGSNKFNRILFGTLSIAFLLFFVYNWWVVSSMPYERFLYIGLGLLVYICEYMYLKAIQNDL